jgi:hypothetical protein
MQRQRKNGYAPAAAFLNAYLGLDDKEQSFTWLERAVEERSNLLTLLKMHLGRFTLQQPPSLPSIRCERTSHLKNSWRAESRSPFAPHAERVAYIIFTGPRSSFMVWNAGVFFLVVSQWPSEYSRINCTVKKLPRITLES